MDRRCAILALFITFVSLTALAADYPEPQSGTFVVKDFQFKSARSCLKSSCTITPWVRRKKTPAERFATQC